MNENVKTTCVCECGYDKGAFKKTIENNIFTIFGNIMKNNHIILRYHGELIEKINYDNYNDNIYISYYFDDMIDKTTHTALAKCEKCIGENYCALINLANYNKITFEFYIKNIDINNQDENTSLEQERLTFNLNIKNNPLTDVLYKYGVEENPLLPTAPSTSTIQLGKIAGAVKKFFISLFKIKSVT